MSQTNERRALLITEDKDFGELVFRQQLVHAGVILVRLAGLSVGAKTNIVSTTLTRHEVQLPGAFTVISPGMLRIRHRVE